MKILFLSPAGNLGGAERVLLDALASLRRAQPDWLLELIIAAPGALAEEAEKLGVSTLALPFPRALATLGDAAAGGPAGNDLGWTALAGRLCLALPGVALYFRRLREAIKAASPDLVHANGFKMHWLGTCAAPRAIPVIWHLHDFVATRPLMRRLLLTQVRRCAEAIAVSSGVAQDARRALGPSIPLATIINAIDLGRFTPEGPHLDLDRLAGLARAEEGTIRIGMVSTMARWKGHEVFLHALAALPPGLPVRGYVIGGPVYETSGSQYSIAELEEIARRHGLAGRVGFTGFVTDVPAALRALDIIVHASTEPEPFGLIIAEAMACGRAVIASAGGGAAEIAADGDCVLTHQPGDQAALTQLMTRLAEDRELRRRLGSAGAASALRRFDRERLAYELQPIYERVTTRKDLKSSSALLHQAANRITKRS